MELDVRFEPLRQGRRVDYAKILINDKWVGNEYTYWPVGLDPVQVVYYTLEVCRTRAEAIAKSTVDHPYDNDEYVWDDGTWGAWYPTFDDLDDFINRVLEVPSEA